MVVTNGDLTRTTELREVMAIKGNQMVMTDISLEGEKEVEGWIKADLDSSIEIMVIGVIINGVRLRITNLEVEVLGEEVGVGEVPQASMRGGAPTNQVCPLTSSLAAWSMNDLMMTGVTINGVRLRITNLEVEVLGEEVGVGEMPQTSVRGGAPTNLVCPLTSSPAAWSMNDLKN